MRRREYAGTLEQGRAVLENAVVMQLAGMGAEGQPVLKSVHGIVEGDWIFFHSSPVGEKTSLLNTSVVLSAEEIVAHIPSYFIDAQRACPATTLYRSVQVHGQLTAVEDVELKARVLQKLMEKFQPEGGHVALEASHPLYRAAVRGLLIAGLPLAKMSVKTKLGQNRSPEQRAHMVERLWARGLPGDARAMELIREANPNTPVPAFLSGVGGLSLHGWLPSTRLSDAAALLASHYWNERFSSDELMASHRASAAWVGAVDEESQLVATARAISDGAKCAWIYDVCVREDWRGKGVGQALMRLLLAHPAVRHCRIIRLGTRDAELFYSQFGFVRTAAVQKSYSTIEMILNQPRVN